MLFYVFVYGRDSDKPAKIVTRTSEGAAAGYAKRAAKADDVSRVEIAKTVATVTGGE